jgi:hypothetical protein
LKAMTEDEQKEALRLLRLLIQKALKYAESHKSKSDATPQHRLHDSLMLAEAIDEARGFCNDQQDLQALLERGLEMFSGPGPLKTTEE